MSKPSYQRFEPRHLSGVLSLYAQVFGADAAQHFKQRLFWSQHAGDAQQASPAWVVVHHEQVVGYVGSVVLPYAVHGQTVFLATPADYMVAPSHAFYGLGLMRTFFAHVESCFAADDIPATIRVSEWLGAKSIGTLKRYVAVLNPIGMALARGHRLASRLQLVQSPVRWLWQSFHAFSLRRLHPVVSLQNPDARFDVFFEQQRQAQQAAVFKNQQFLTWRYGSGSPHAQARFGVCVDRQGALLGYVIYAALSEGMGVVFDIQTLPTAPLSVFESLLRYAKKQLHRDGSLYVRCHFFEPSVALQAVLKRYHFSERSAKHSVLFKASNITAPTAWALGYGDLECSHALP